MKKKYNAVVIGSGPNGFAAAISLAEKGFSVKMFEAKETVGGGMRTAELTLPGFKHDICSAVHPLAAASPFFNLLTLEKFELEWIYPEVEIAHPLVDGDAVSVYRSIEKTAAQLGKDKEKYLNLMSPLVENWNKILPDILSPLNFPKHLSTFVKFGLKALPSSTQFNKKFSEEKTKALFAGMAAHSIVDPKEILTSAMGLVLLITAHSKGWPFPKGGSENIAAALYKYFLSLGGEVETNNEIKSFKELPPAEFYFFDVTPKQLIKICGSKLSKFYKYRLKKFRYGPGVFKIDYALSEPIPWKNNNVKKTAAVHIGSSEKEIAEWESSVHKGIYTNYPFLILAQHSLFDETRAPSSKHTAWVYAHVPNNSEKDISEKIEMQIERFAPGFKDIIISKNKMNSDNYHSYNPNYIGGDINGGLQDWKQLFTRPVVSINPYQTSNRQIYICSSSTPPGGGVHGMCGFNAAQKLLKKLKKLS